MLKRGASLASLMVVMAGSCGLLAGCAEDNNANMVNSKPAPGSTPVVAPASSIPAPPPGPMDSDQMQKYQQQQNQQMYKNYPGKAPQ